MPTAAARLLLAILALALLGGCQTEDTRAQVVLERVDQIVAAVIIDEQSKDGMTVEADEIRWTAGSEWANEKQFEIPDLPMGTPVSVIAPKPGDRPAAGDRVLLYLAYQAPQGVTILVGDPESGEFTGSSERATHAGEALAAGRRLRAGMEAQQVAIELIEGARAINDARAGRGGPTTDDPQTGDAQTGDAETGDPETVGGLMREVTPELSPENGGPTG